MYYSFYGAKAIYTFNLSNKKFGLYTELKTKSGINQTFDFRYVIKHNEFLAVADPFKLKVDIYKHGKFKTTLYVDSLLHDSVNVTKENFINAFMNKSKISTMGFFGFNTIFVNCLMKEPDHYEKAYNFFIDLTPRKPRIFSCVLSYVDTKLFDKNPACYKQPTFFENFISKGSHFYTFTAEYMENSCTKTWLECYNSRLIDELTVEEYEIIYH